MNSTPQQLVQSSWRILEHSTSPSLREILAAFKFSKGQDADCQLLLAVLNAKSAEDQRTAAIANLHARLLDSQPDRLFTSIPSPPQTYSIPRPHIPSPAPPRSHSPYSPSAHCSDSSYEGPRSHRPIPSPRPSRKYRRSPYDRPIQMVDDEAHPRGSRYYYQSQRSPCSSPNGSDESSPRSRETMSIGTLLSSQNPRLEEDERGVSSERSTTSRKLSP